MRFSCRQLLLLLFVLLGLSAPAVAVIPVFYWDLNGATSGLGLGNGTWDAGTTNWSSSPSGDVTPQGWVNNSIASITYDGDVTDSTLTLGSDITLAGLRAEYNPRAVTIEGNGHKLTLTGSAEIYSSALGDLTINAQIDGAAGLAKKGDYDLVLMKANTYTGVTTVSDYGNLRIFDNAALGATGGGNGTVINSLATVAIGHGLTVAETFTLNGGTLRVDANGAEGSDVTLTGPITLTADSSLIGNHSNDALLNITGVISETGGPHTLLVDGVILSGNNTFTGELFIGDSGGLSVASFNNNGVAGAFGAGTGLTLGYNNEGTYNGRVTYTGGTASSTRSIRILGGTGTVAVSEGATELTLTGQITGHAFGVSDPQLEKAGPGTLILTGNNTYTGDTLLTNGTLVVGSSSALGLGETVKIGTEGTRYDDHLQLLLGSGVTLGQYVHVYNPNNDGGTTTLGLSGTGTATFGEEVYITRSVDVKVNAGGTLNFNEYFSDGDGGGHVTKSGGGVAVFNDGIDLRGGGLTINGGEVRLNAGFIYFDSGINVNNGTKLSGSGSITGDRVFVSSGGTLSPGNGIGTLTMQSLNMDAGSHMNWGLGALTTTNTAQFDRIVVATQSETDSLFIDASATLTLDLSLLGGSDRPDQSFALNNPFWQTTRIWQIVEFSGYGIDSFGAGGQLNPFVLTNGTFVGGVFSTFVGNGSGGFTAGNVFLQFTPVPEPSTWALLGSGGALLWLAARRRRA